jgi:N-acylneuraminate cytidylyltransferase/CMP-N,N'-diacetyllegionaminic acid synthase
MSDEHKTTDLLANLSIICTICARGGSKGVPNKNVRLLGGKPLIAHTVTQAKATGLFDAIAVSSDSEQILRIAGEWGADHLVKRPAALATDNAAKVPSMQHCVQEVEKRTGKTFDVVVDLDATAPLRLPEDIRGTVELLLSQPCSNVLSGNHARRSPYYNLLELDERGYIVFSKPLPDSVMRRQDAPPCFDANASIYAWRRDSLFESPQVIREATLLYIMPEERSHDIDSELDFKIVELMMQHEAEKAGGKT